MEGIPTLKCEETCTVKCEDNVSVQKQHVMSGKLLDTQVEGKYT